MIDKIKSLFKNKELYNYIVIFGVEFSIMIIGVILFKIINLKYGNLGFAEYTLNKRLIGFLTPLLILGMGVSLPKFLPLENKENQKELYHTGLLIVTVCFIVSAAICLLLGKQFSQLVYGDQQHGNMILVILFYTYGLLLHACIYNYFRGSFNFPVSGALQIINLGILPLVVYFFSNTVMSYFLLLTILNIITFTIVNLLYLPIAIPTLPNLKQNIQKLMSYGLQRTPGDIALGLFLAVPSFIVSNYFSIIEAGNIAFNISLFNIVIAVMAPLNVILLPQASKIVHEKKFEQLKKLTTNLLLFSTSIGVIVWIVVYFSGHLILELFSIETDNTQILSYLFIIFSGIIGYSVFSLMRSIVDAYYATARISTLIIASFLIFILSTLVLKYVDLFSISNLLIAYSLSLNMLGILTFISIKRVYKLSE